MKEEMKEKKGIVRIIGDTLAYLTGKGKVEPTEILEISQKTEREEEEKEDKDDQKFRRKGGQR